jgi:hypothetical protein
MELLTCALCGRLFETYNSIKKICPKCAEKEEEYYKEVKTLIREQPGLTFKDIIAETGVPERLMRRWLQDGRLEINTRESYGLKCERCRKEILQGKYCVDCRQIMQNGLNDLMKESRKIQLEQDSNKKKGSGMRFIND